MSDKPRILVFSGSSREASCNTKLARFAAKAVEQMGGEATFVDLAEYPMPIYNGDLEAADGMPQEVRGFKELMKSHQGFLISSPEYNSSISPLLKNTIDWASRAEGEEKPLEAFAGKTAALLSASPGGLGGLRGLVHLRSILGNIQVLVIPEQFALGNAFSAFSDDGSLADAAQATRVQGIAKRLVDVTAGIIKKS